MYVVERSIVVKEGPALDGGWTKGLEIQRVWRSGGSGDPEGSRIHQSMKGGGIWIPNGLDTTRTTATRSIASPYRQAYYVVECVECRESSREPQGFGWMISGV